MSASRPFSQKPSSHRPTEWLSSSSSFIASTRSRVSGLVCRSLASWASPSSTLTRTGWAGSVAMSTVSFRRPSMIASASFASSPASCRTQSARSWTMSRITSSLASSARAAQRMPLRARHVAVLVDRRGERLAEQRRDLDRCASASATAPLTMPPSRSWSSAFEHVGDQPRGAGADARAFARRRSARKRPTAPATSTLLHPPRDHRRGEEIVLEEVGERVADPVLVARDDRGVRDRQAERMAEQRGHREPVGEAADHRRFGEGADEAEPRIEMARARARRRRPPP